MKCIECGAECEKQVVCKSCAETLERIRKLIQAYLVLGIPRLIDDRRQPNA